MNMKWLLQCWGWRRTLAQMAAGDLSSEQEKALRAHLAKCERCRHHFHELEQAAAGLKTWAAQLPLNDPGDDVRVRWRNAILNAASAEKQSLQTPVFTLLSHGYFRPVALFCLGIIWSAIMFLNLASPPTVREGSRISASPHQFLMVLKQKPADQGEDHSEYQRAHSETQPVPPQSQNGYKRNPVWTTMFEKSIFRPDKSFFTVGAAVGAEVTRLG